MHKTVPVVALSHIRTVGPLVMTGSLATVLLLSFQGFDAYEGRYSSGLGLVVLAIVSIGLIFLLLPVALVDCVQLLKRGCAAYVSDGRLGIYRASPWIPWRRGFVEVPLKSIKSIEIVGRSLRWGHVIRLTLEGEDDLSVETFYMRGQTEEVLDTLRITARSPDP